MGRPISQSQRRWLSDELGHWLASGIVVPDQRDAILACYETTDEAGQRNRLWASFVLASLAALLVGMGVLLVVGYNWQIVVAGWEALPTLVKLGAILALIVGVQGAAIHVRRNTPYRRASEVLFLFGSMLYGAGIWLVAQVFHVSAHWPDGIWWWALGVLPVALLMDTMALHALSTGLLALWIGGEIFGFGNWWWHLVPNGCYSLPLLAALGLAWCYRKGSPWGLACYVALAAWWVVLQAAAWGWDDSLFFFVTMAGAIALVVAENHQPGSRMARPYRVIGTLLVAGGLVALGSVDFHEHVFRSQAYAGDVEFDRLAITVALAGLLAVTLVFSALLKPVGQTGGPALGRLAALGRQQAGPLTIAGATVLMALVDGAMPAHAALLAAVVANVAMIALAIWLMRVGIRDEHGQAFAAGVVYLLLWAILRYVDLFGAELGMLGGAAMFILCGLGLLALAILWRKRKEIRRV